MCPGNWQYSGVRNRRLFEKNVIAQKSNISGDGALQRVHPRIRRTSELSASFDHLHPQEEQLGCWRSVSSQRWVSPALRWAVVTGMWVDDDRPENGRSSEEFLFKSDNSRPCVCHDRQSALGHSPNTKLSAVMTTTVTSIHCFAFVLPVER